MAQVENLSIMQLNHPMESIFYNIPHSEQKIQISTSVLDIFKKFRQIDSLPEAGGLLFAEFEFPLIKIVKASPPNKSDKRWRTLFVPNRILQRRLIKKLFKSNQHFIGEWHTHPTNVPRPSSLDLESTMDSFVKSKHELNYFIMVIVGNSLESLELWVSLHNEKGYCKLVPNC